MRIPIWAVVALALAALAGAVAVIAGPLNPPTGPVAPTYKTLAEVEPRTPVESLAGSPTALHIISAPGSYYLTGPITGAPGKSAIEISASKVTLDLRGFSLAGVPGALDGVRITAPVTGLTIQGGAAANWPGLAFNLALASNSTLERLRADSSDSGILAGSAAHIAGCSAESNALAGIATGEHALVTDCHAASNGGNGFYLSDGSTADCCTAVRNAAHGFYLDGDGCTVRASTARSNSGGGVTSIYSCTLENSLAEFNTLAGFSSAGAAIIRDCAARHNDGGGFIAAPNSALSHCEARANTLFGIRVESRCLVESSTCAENRGFSQGPGAGILAAGASNRLDSNTLVSNDIGLKTLAPSNLIIRNNASGNATAFDLSPDQSAGPIITGPAPITTTSPWANFIH
jgi:hypothetical protein